MKSSTRATCLPFFQPSAGALALTILLGAFPGYSHAQNIEGQIVASQFGEWKVPSIGTGFAFDPASCQVTGGGKNFAAFSNGTPIKVVDENPALTEISNATVYAHIGSSSCSVSLGGLAYAHTAFYLTSGTGGLQEALNNSLSRSGGPNTIILNAEWYELVGPADPATVIAGVTGSSGFGLVDVTTSPYTTYIWNGSQYVSNTVTGVTIPNTALVLKGGGAEGLSAPAVPGTDYVIPSGNIAGTAGNLSGTPALPNGTTATTQISNDNTAKLATDAFVNTAVAAGGGSSGTQYTAGAGGVTARTLVMGDGSGNVIPYIAVAANSGLYTGIATATAASGNTTTVASSSGQLVACQFDGPPVVGDAVVGSTTTPADCHDNGANPVYDVSARIPVVGWVQSVAGTVGTVRLAGLGVWGSGNIVVNNSLSPQTFLGPLAGPQFSLAKLGSIFYADGFTTANGFLGIGVAQTAWNSSTNYNQCSAVSTTAGSITAWSITGTAPNQVVTFTISNTLSAGAWVTLSGFATSTFFNGLSVQVMSAGLSNSQFEAKLVPVGGYVAGSTFPNNGFTNSSGTESGAATSNWISVVHLNQNITPGTNSNDWYPVPNGNTPQQMDCAFYSAAGSIVNGADGAQTSGGNGAVVVMGNGVYQTGIGLLEPTVTNIGSPATVSLIGQGMYATTIQLVSAKKDALAEVEQPDTLVGYQFATFTWYGFQLEASFHASSVAGVYGAVAEVISNVLFSDPADFNDHVVEFGDGSNTADGWTYQPALFKLGINANHGGVGASNMANISATVSGGVPSFTINSGGAGYNDWGSDTYATLLGYADFGRACSNMGTTTLTITSGVITGISSTATGCVAPLYVSINSGQNINYGYKFSNVSDTEQIEDLITSTGLLAGLYIGDYTAQVNITRYHPDNTLVGLDIEGQANFISPQFDTVRQIAMKIAGASVDSIISPTFEWSDTNGVGYVDYYFPDTVGTSGYNQPIAVYISGEGCTAQATMAGYAHVATGAGYVDYHVGSGGGSLPLYVHDSGAAYCNEFAGSSTPAPSIVAPNYLGQQASWSNGVYNNDWIFNMGTDFGTSNPQVMTVTQQNLVTGANLGTYLWNFANTNAATSSFNSLGPVIEDSAAYWNGSASVPLGINQQLSFTSGSSPIASYAFMHNGTLPSGGLQYTFDNTVSVPGFKDTGATGSAQCAQFNSSGVLSGTGSACGSGAGSSWSGISNPSANLALSMAAYTSAFTYDAATGTSDLFKLTDTAANTGTGIMAHFTTASGSTEIPFQADSNGVGWQVNASGNLVSTNTAGNAAVSFGVGSGGDSTCPAATSGTSYLCTKNDGIAASINGAGYLPISTAPALPVTAGTTAGSTYYVDNVSGSDSNNGTSQSTPWKTVAHVNAATIASGSQVLFLSSDVWHEQITVQSAGITYGAYGPQRNCTLSSTLVAYCTSMPIIDGADVITGWSLVTGTTYSAPYASTASKGFVDSLYAQAAPLAPQTSLANVEANPGSIYSNGTLVFVNLLDGSSPTNHTVEVSGSRAYAINLNAQAATTIKGLEIIRTAKSGIIGAASTANANSETITNNVFFNIGDTLGDSTFGLGANSAEGAVFALQYSPTLTGWSIIGNWIGQMDLTPSTLSYTQAGVDLGESTGAVINGNTIATVNGTAIQVTDGFNPTAGLCATPVISNNLIVNSQGGINLYGCSSAAITQNKAHDSYGNMLEIGGGFQTGDQNNNAPYVANNEMWNLSPAYSNGLYNGIDVNHATNGVATGNKCQGVANDCMTLEADSGPSSGWQVYGNTFDATNNGSYNGTACTSSNRCFAMYVRNTSLSGGLTMRANSLTGNAATGYLTRWGATSSSDFTHDLTQAAFDLAYPNYETTGEIGTFLHLTSTGTLPTAVGGTGAGSGPPTITVAGTDTRGTLTFTAGTSPATQAAVATITFATPFSGSGTVFCQAVTGSNAANSSTVYVSSTSLTGFVLSSSASALIATNNEQFIYSCGQ